MNDQYWHFLGLKPGASAGEISAARNRLSKLFHPDRGGTAEDMARLNEAFEIVTGKRTAPSSGAFGGSSSSGSLGDLARILQLELTIRGLQDQLNNARKQHDISVDSCWRVIEERRKIIETFEGLCKALANTMLDAGWLRPAERAMLARAAIFEPDMLYEAEEFIEMARQLIDGPVKEAVAKANAQSAPSPAPKATIFCLACGKPFVPARSDAKTCSNTCRQALYRSRLHNGSNGSAQPVSGTNTHSVADHGS